MSGDLNLLLTFACSVADPGFIYSALLREAPGWLLTPAFWLYSILGLMQPARVGAETVLDAALADPVSLPLVSFYNSRLC